MNKKSLDYKDISLVPRQVSTLKSRTEANTGIDCFGIHLDVPMIASPMPDVCNGEMARQLANIGGLGIIHRFQSIEEQVNEYKTVVAYDTDGHGIVVGEHQMANVACAIGIGGDYQDRFKSLYKEGCRIFCLDTANGANEMVGEAVKWVREQKVEGDNLTYLIAGNVASKQGYQYLAQLGVDAVRVGIAGGSVCETKTETGIYMPMVSAIEEAYVGRNEYAYAQTAQFLSENPTEEYLNLRNGDASNTASAQKIINYIVSHPKFKEFAKKSPLIIADGGIKTPSDMCKALVIGADLIMAGGIFAGTIESPGDVHSFGGDLVKLYRGAASFSVQRDYNGGKKPTYVEGREGYIKYRDIEVSKVIKRFKGGLESSMSYMDARTLDEYRMNSDVVYL